MLDERMLTPPPIPTRAAAATEGRQAASWETGEPTHLTLPAPSGSCDCGHGTILQMPLSQSLTAVAMVGLTALTWAQTVAGEDLYMLTHRRTDDAPGAGEGEPEGVKYFAIPAMFVTMREALEAVIILSVMLRFVEKIGKPELKRDVWQGTAAGLSGALIFAVIFLIIFYAIKTRVFDGTFEAVFELVLKLFAAVVITALAIGMLKVSNMEQKWERKLKASLKHAENKSGGMVSRRVMFWVMVTAVFREGVETVIFLTGVAGGYPARDIPIPGIVGLIIGLMIGWGLWRFGSEANLKLFLTMAMVLLLFISAGLSVRAVYELVELGAFGSGAHVEPAWNICEAAPNTNKFLNLCTALFGYTCEPTPMEILAYVGFWVIAITALVYKMRWACFKNVPVKEYALEDDNMDVYKTKNLSDVMEEGKEGGLPQQAMVA